MEKCIIYYILYLKYSFPHRETNSTPKIQHQQFSIYIIETIAPADSQYGTIWAAVLSGTIFRITYCTTLRKTLTEYLNNAYQSKKTFLLGQTGETQGNLGNVAGRVARIMHFLVCKSEKKVPCLCLAMFGNKFQMHTALFIPLSVHTEKCALYSEIGKYFGFLLLFPKSTTYVRLPILFYSYFSKSQAMVAFNRSRHNRKGKQYSLDLVNLCVLLQQWGFVAVAY